MKHQIDLEVSEKVSFALCTLCLSFMNPQAFHAADEAMRANLPGLIQAIYALAPRLVHALCMVQNTLLGHYYTALHDFCQQYGYLIPTPEWRQVQAEFDDVFGTAKRDTESISTLQRGKAVNQAFYSRSDSQQTRTVSHRNGLTPVRSNGRLPPPVPTQGMSVTPPPLDLSTRPARTVSNTSYGRPSPPPSTASFHTAATDYFVPPGSAGATTRRTSSQPASPYLGSGGSVASAAVSAAASIASKKKPPPPPPPKRKTSAQQQDYVIAQYDFAGEGVGDLSFREGDKILVVQRTVSQNDWWEGECRGMRGSFPANYCKAA
jgi:hypothetical protein